MRAVVLGGYGNFGARISRALAGEQGIEIVVAGRGLARARSLAGELGCEAAAIDTRAAGLAQALAALGAQLVVHAAGPFQGQDYSVARAALAAGSHYIDLADGRRFVCDFATHLDAAFRQAGRVAITGASTVPALSSAVVDAGARTLVAVETIDVCIAPAQKAPRGEATVAGVLSYCGGPVQVWRDGRWQSKPGWAQPERVAFAHLKPRRAALCDTPDLELFPVRYPDVQSVAVRAALEVGAAQAGFAFVAWLRQRGWLRSPEKLAALMNRAGAVFDLFGTPDGGMFVRLAGRDAQGVARRAAWHLTAPDHHGPEVPCMAAVLLARRMASGGALPPGAYPCMGLLTLADFEREFARWGMRTEWEGA